MISKFSVISSHARANDSDPFAGARMYTHIRQGIVNQEDFPAVLVTAGYAHGQRRGQANRAIAKGQFVSMRKV